MRQHALIRMDGLTRTPLYVVLSHFRNRFMILPQSYPAVLFLMVLSMLCLGSWASLFKFAGKWRFELFYLDFAVGLLFALVIYAFTFGNIGFDGFNFLDDLQHAGKRQWMYVFVAGLIFNLGNMLLMAAVSVRDWQWHFPWEWELRCCWALVWG